VRQRDRESTTDSDPHGLLFGPSDEGSFFDDESHTGNIPRVARVSRSESRAAASRHTQRRRNRRVVGIVAALFVLVVAVATWLVVLPIYHYLNPQDYSGSGTGVVVVTVRANDDASAIGKTLHDKGVVASVRAFTDVASNNSKSKTIQPGSYRLHEHMSASKALALMLDPASRVKSDVVVTEGATTLDILKRLTSAPCSASANASAVCGPGLAKVDVERALKNVKALGLPTDFKVGGKAPVSAEGFLFPATYFFPDNTVASDALQQMIEKFTEQARSTNFTARAKALHLTPYQELIIASIAQSEARYPDDFPKVARVILNRLAAKKPLQIDATSRYGARLQGLDPNKINYPQFDSPYNTYLHDGLTPTPISNPGADAMDGVSKPAPGNWLYYVNGDKDGHLYFTNSESAFVKAVHKCQVNHWGC
jgi:UPF0755 protein